MTYSEFISQCKSRILPECTYTEIHHIIPKCLNGKNNKENLIELTAQEHYIAHKLLAEENPFIEKLQYAWANMVFHNGLEITAEEYEAARIKKSELISGNKNNHWKDGRTYDPDYDKNLAHDYHIAHQEEILARHTEYRKSIRGQISSVEYNIKRTLKRGGTPRKETLEKLEKLKLLEKENEKN